MTRRNILAVAFWVSVALLAFSATAVAVRALSTAFSAFEILSIRNSAGVAILLTLALLKPGLRREMRPRNLPLHVVRNACRYGDASVVVPLDFLRIPLIALVGWQFYGEAPDAFVFLGSFSIVAGILWTQRAEAGRRPA